MGLSLWPTIANVFLLLYELKPPEQCTSEFRPVLYRRYIDDIFVLFESVQNLSKFHAYTCFWFEHGKNVKLSFLDVEVSRQQGRFVTTVYMKPTFSGVYFLPTVKKFGMIYTVAYRCFEICCDETDILKFVAIGQNLISWNEYL